MAILNVIEGLCSICVLFMFYFGACVLFCVLFFATFFGQLAFLLISVLIRSLQLLSENGQNGQNKAFSSQIYCQIDSTWVFIGVTLSKKPVSSGRNFGYPS